MAEQEPNARDHYSREALRYLPLSQDTEAQRQIRNAKVVGGIISFLSGVIGVVIWFFAALGSSLGGKQSFDCGSLVCPGMIAGVLVLLTLYEHFYVKRRGFLQGVLIGIGVAALIEGACFTLLR